MRCTTCNSINVINIVFEGDTLFECRDCGYRIENGLCVREGKIYKEFSWTIQRNAVNPDIYSKIHLTKDGGVWTLCGLMAPRLSNPEVKTINKDVKELYNQEIVDRDNPGLDGGLYCIRCLKKAINKIEGDDIYDRTRNNKIVASQDCRE